MPYAVRLEGYSALNVPAGTTTTTVKTGKGTREYEISDVRFVGLE